jgi:hypothetical protein
MRLSVGTVFCLLLIGFAASDAAPVRPPRGPAPSEPEQLDLRGSRWFGKTYEGTDWTIIFEPNGGITNIENGNTYKVGSWKATGGNTVYMELNNVYYEFRGAVTGDVLAGDSSNKVGLRWTTTFRRIAQSQ